jgi:putative transposase
MNPAASPSRAFHVWFSTKGRKPALVDEIRDFVIASFDQVAVERGLVILEVEAIEDHVHLLLALRRDQRLATAVHDLKGATARSVYARYPELRLDMRSDSLWQKSYGARAVPEEEIENVRRYIRTQEDRPLRHE